MQVAHRDPISLQAPTVRISLNAFSTLFVQRVKGFCERIKAKDASCLKAGFSTKLAELPQILAWLLHEHASLAFLWLISRMVVIFRRYKTLDGRIYPGRSKESGGPKRGRSAPKD